MVARCYMQIVQLYLPGGANAHHEPTHGSLGPHKSDPKKWHLNRFSYFCTACSCDQQQTHRQTCHEPCYVQDT